MRTIDDHPVRFGELAGPLLAGPRLFDYQLISTQAVTKAAGHSFETIVADDGIPYAPVEVRASVQQYPTFDDTLTVQAEPLAVGETSLEILYEVHTDADELVSQARIVHVTIAPDGGALTIPADVRDTYRTQTVDRDVTVGSGADTPTAEAGAGSNDADAFATISDTFDIRSPHVENSRLAYFEEYPRFAAVALERYLDDSGAPVPLADGPTPLKLADWAWEFRSPVPYRADLDVTADVVGVTEEHITVEHTFAVDGEACIVGTTTYGGFDTDGQARPLPEEIRAAVRDS